MARNTKDVLIIGVGGHIVAVDPTTGTELWRTKLKMSSFVTVRTAGARVYAGRRRRAVSVSTPLPGTSSGATSSRVSAWALSHSAAATMS